MRGMGGYCARGGGGGPGSTGAGRGGLGGDGGAGRLEAGDIRVEVMTSGAGFGLDRLVLYTRECPDLVMSGASAYE